MRYHLAQLEAAVTLADMAGTLDPLRAAGYYNLACFRYAAGDLDGAVRALQRALALRDPGMADLKVDRPLHADPRYTARLQRIGFATKPAQTES